MTWTIVTESGQTVAEQTVGAVLAGNRLHAQAQVPVASLPAGTYELRATVLVANQATGVTSTSFRKADKQVGACGYQPGGGLASFIAIG